jgi:hypothetical protein
MPIRALFSLVLAFAGLGLLLAGFLAAFREHDFSTAGADAARSTDAARLARLAGGTILLLGLVFVVAAAVAYALPEARLIVGVVIGAATIVAMVVTSTACSRILRRD